MLMRDEVPFGGTAGGKGRCSRGVGFCAGYALAAIAGEFEPRGEIHSHAALARVRKSLDNIQARAANDRKQGRSAAGDAHCGALGGRGGLARYCV